MDRVGRRAFLTTAVTATAGCVAAGNDPALTAVVPGRNYPFAYRSRCCEWERSSLDGFDVAVLTAVAEHQDAKFEATSVDGDPLDALRAGEADLVAPGRPLPPDPPEGIGAVGPTLRGYDCLLVRAGVDGIEALADGRVAVAPGPRRRGAVDSLGSLAADAEPVAVESVAAGHDRLGDDVDAVLGDHVRNALRAAGTDAAVLAGAGTAAPGYDTPDLVLGTNEYGYLVATGEPTSERIGSALSALRGAGTLADLRAERFTPERRPRSR